MTDKIYHEGVEKGNQEAQKLIANAQEEANKIIINARNEAELILAAAKKSADELSENTKSELQLYTGQAVNALKSEITNLLRAGEVEPARELLMKIQPVQEKIVACIKKYCSVS